MIAHLFKSVLHKFKRAQPRPDLELRPTVYHQTFKHGMRTYSLAPVKRRSRLPHVQRLHRDSLR
jgi:hypothetical protein